MEPRAIVEMDGDDDFSIFVELTGIGEVIQPPGWKCWIALIVGWIYPIILGKRESLGQFF